MKPLVLTLIILAGCQISFAQQKLQLNLSNSCSHDGETFDRDIYGYPPSPEAQEMVRSICDAVGLQPRFELRVANVPNATATIQGGKRLILYSENFMLKVSSSTGSSWAALGILAHEIGHHLNNDPLEEGESRPEIELDADEFSGRVLALLGATIEQAQAAVQNTNANGSATHPPRRARLEAVLQGWKRGGGGGAPDFDGDKTPDAADDCPQEFGSAKTKGCPDADDDGIANKNDKCPFDKGTLEREGCPVPVVAEADNDGVPDHIDKCKNEKGLTSNDGCPDSDGDGVPDHIDKCKNEKGLTSSDGCPDSDSDGISDKEDKCPNQSGTSRFEGCPDTDGDNVPDHIDDCKNEKGLKSNYGCPDLEGDSIRLDMVLVKGGTFDMGGDDVESQTNEKPVHSVTVDDFYLGKYEVTQKEWRAVMGSDHTELSFPGCDRCPVEGVSWDKAKQFIKKLNEKTNSKYRLPTEAEWEFAARGGNSSPKYKYAESNKLNEVAWYSSNSVDRTHPVGCKKANRLGLFDMSGNVWEWCQDPWHDNYFGAPTDGRTWSSGGALTARVLRGGSFNTYAKYCRSASRLIGTAGVGGYFDRGFRVAQDR